MSRITDEGILLLSRITEGNLVFTRATTDTGFAFSFVSETKEGDILKITLRGDNTEVTERINYTKVLVYAKIDGDATDVVYAEIDKVDYIPSVDESPEFVVDFVVGFVFSNLNQVTVNLSTSVYALDSEVEALRGYVQEEIGKIVIPGVINSLTSTSTVNALAAYQGKVLNEKITTAKAVTGFLTIPYNDNTQKNINLGFEPSMVVLSADFNSVSSETTTALASLLATKETVGIPNKMGYDILTNYYQGALTTTGFWIKFVKTNMSSSYQSYIRYVAFR